MKRMIFMIMSLMLLATTGCATTGGSAVAGAVGGAAASAGGYEYKAHEEMKRIDEELKAGRMDKKEHDIRADEIRRMSILQ